MCCLSSATSARLVGVVDARGVCGCKPIFLQGMALRPEKYDKLTCSSHHCSLLRQVHESGRKALAVYYNGVEGNL
jgi:hypothetical protein